MRKSWTQTEEGRKRMSEIQKKIWAEKRSPIQLAKLAKKMTNKAKKRGKYSKKELTEQTTLRVNGWRIILGVNEIRIEHES